MPHHHIHTGLAARPSPYLGNCWTRRGFLLALSMSTSAGAWAEHGWQPYDKLPPLYLEGEVTTIIWADPHPYLELAHKARARLPADLRLRPIPRTRDDARVAQLLAQARVPPAQERLWRVELPSLAQLSRWGAPRPKINQVISVIGFAGPPLKDTPTISAELMFVGERAFPLRTEPAV